MSLIQGADALVSLFEYDDVETNADEQHPVVKVDPGQPREYGNLRMRRPKALVISSSSSTTFLDKSYRGRFPCGRYHRACIIQTTLRKVLPTENARSVTEPIPSQSPPGRFHLDGIKRMFSLKKPEPSPQAPLKPLLLPTNMSMKRSKSENTPKDDSPKVNLVRRLSLSHWLPSSKPREVASTNQPPQRHLRPLVLSPKSSSIASVPPPAENVNILAWFLDCVQRDIKPHWSQRHRVDEQMLLQDGQARCLVVRIKRRSALF